MLKAIHVTSAVVLLAAVSAAQAVPGFTIQDSRGLGDISAVLNFSSSGGSSSFNAGNGNPDAAYPNGTGNNFSLLAHGFLTVDTAGDYTIALNQDDQAFVLIGQSGAPVTIADTGCCSTTTYTRTLEAGTHFISVNMREFGGGESLELSSADGAAVPFGLPAFTLVNGPGSSLTVTTEATDVAGVNPIIGLGTQGFNVIRKNSDIGNIDNITEAESVLGSAAVVASEMRDTIKYNRTIPSSPGTDPFPNGGGNNFIIHASGFIDVLDPDGMDDVAFHVSSDDGFRLRVNGVVVSEFANPTGDSNTISGLFTVKDGDFIELLMYELGGGEALVLSRDLDGNIGTNNDRVLIGDAASGILVFATDDFGPAIIPEPTTASLALLSMTLIGMRRRRQKVTA